MMYTCMKLNYDIVLQTHQYESSHVTCLWTQNKEFGEENIFMLDMKSRLINVIADD